MLGKLMKHEFRATQRIMLPILAAELLLSVFAGFSIRGLNTMPGANDSVFLRAMYFLSLALFFLGIGIRKAGRIGRFKGLLLTLAYAAYTCWVAWPLLRPSIWPAAGPFVEEVLMPLLAPLREAAGQIFGSLF